MLNQLMLVGRIKRINKELKTIEVEVTASDKKHTLLIDTNNLDQVYDYLELDTVVGVKGHLEEPQRIVADKVSFLSSKRKEEE